MDWKYSEDRKSVILPNGKPKQLLKVTGTRFASILGLNSWNTSFQMWCEITKSARLPFTGNMYTEAGQAIEPKVVNYLKKDLYANTLNPEEYYGAMVHRNIRFDFFKDEKIFGGMWDAVMVSKKDPSKIRAIVEIKTTKRAQDWQDGPPLYYLLQVALYAYLSNINDFYLTVSFLEEADYGHPERYEPSVDNTKFFKYKLSELTIPMQEGGQLHNYTFQELVDKVLVWYNTYIITGRSPEFDEDKDAEYLKILREASPKNDQDIDQIVEEINKAESLIESIKKDKELKKLEARVKKLKDNLKPMLKTQLGPNDKSVTYMNFKYAQTKATFVVDEAKLKKAGLFDDYSKEKPGQWRLTKVKVED